MLSTRTWEISAAHGFLPPFARMAPSVWDFSVCVPRGGIGFWILEFGIYFPLPHAFFAHRSIAPYLFSQVVYIAPKIPGTSRVLASHAAISLPSSS